MLLNLIIGGGLLIALALIVKGIIESNNRKGQTFVLNASFHTNKDKGEK